MLNYDYFHFLGTAYLHSETYIAIMHLKYLYKHSLFVFFPLFLFVSLPITATHSASNLVQAAPAYQIPPTLIESDCRGPPRPPLSPRGLCKCV